MPNKFVIIEVRSIAWRYGLLKNEFFRSFHPTQSATDRILRIRNCSPCTGSPLARFAISAVDIVAKEYELHEAEPNLSGLRHEKALHFFCDNRDRWDDRPNWHVGKGVRSNRSVMLITTKHASMFDNKTSRPWRPDSARRFHPMQNVMRG
jgi:hypothetical protein